MSASREQIVSRIENGLERGAQRSVLSRRAALVASLATIVACASPPQPASPRDHTEPTAPATAPADERIDSAKAHALVADGARLVDVRTPEEYAEGHIDGAENVPVDTIGAHDFGDKNAPIVVYCGSGKRAGRARETLRTKGYTRVYNMGGMSSWDASK